MEKMEYMLIRDIHLSIVNSQLKTFPTFAAANTNSFITNKSNSYN